MILSKRKRLEYFPGSGALFLGSEGGSLETAGDGERQGQVAQEASLSRPLCRLLEASRATGFSKIVFSFIIWG